MVHLLYLTSRTSSILTKIRRVLVAICYALESACVSDVPFIYSISGFLSSFSMTVIIAVVAAGAMGAGVGKRLVQNGCVVLTCLAGRSESTKRRAVDAGMTDASYTQILEQADVFLSILPPSDAVALAQTLAEQSTGRRILYVDCNAVNPETVKKIAGLFVSTSIDFVDAGIIGGPPSDGYDPKFYAAADDARLLDEFESLSKYGLKISGLRGEGAGIGDASALKMSYAVRCQLFLVHELTFDILQGITKGTTALLSTMILGKNLPLLSPGVQQSDSVDVKAAHEASPATADALLQELHSSQPAFLQRITVALPSMFPKAYRWSGEMEEIAGFVREKEIYVGMGKLYERIEKNSEDVEVLKKFVETAKRTLA